MQHRFVPHSPEAGGTSWGLKSVMLLSVIGALLVTGCVSPLYRAAARNDIDTANKLLDRGADVNGKNSLNGAKALKAASSQGNIEMAKLLLDRGADVNLASGNMGWTALSNAAWAGHAEMAILLVDRGADINKAIAGLNRGMVSGNAIAMLNELKYKRPMPTHGQDSAAAFSSQPAPTALPPPAESATPF